MRLAGMERGYPARAGHDKFCQGESLVASRAGAQ